MMTRAYRIASTCLSRSFEASLDQKTCEALAEENMDKTDGAEILNNSFESNEGSVGANTAR